MGSGSCRCSSECDPLMKVFRVAADSSCLIGLVHIRLFESIKDLFAEIYIPSAVYNEVVVQGKGKFGVDEIEAAVKAGGWPAKRPYRYACCRAFVSHTQPGRN